MLLIQTIRDIDALFAALITMINPKEAAKESSQPAKVPTGTTQQIKCCVSMSAKDMILQSALSFSQSSAIGSNVRYHISTKAQAHIHLVEDTEEDHMDGHSVEAAAEDAVYNEESISQRPMRRYMRAPNST